MGPDIVEHREAPVSNTRVSTERDIAAPADVVYGILADYVHHHPRILPPAISGLVVEEGGVGEGTIIRFSTSVAGRTQAFRQRVEEPEPGRVIREIDIDGETATTFTVTPRGGTSHVRIETTMPARGIRGMIERFVAPMMLRPVYRDELERLDAYARGRAGQ